MRRFRQVDVFSPTPCQGNPVAVVLDGEGLSNAQMQRFANWTNLSETTFVLPAGGDADYRVRIFTPDVELPFAGHPTLGTCHAWLEAGGSPHSEDIVVQQCDAGLIRVRLDGSRLAFAAPPLLRSGPVGEDTVDAACVFLGVDRSAIVDSQWVDNGPGWLGVQLGSAEALLALSPMSHGMEATGVGVIGPHPLGVVARREPGEAVESGISPEIEVRAFFRSGERVVEDPVTGSLNASLAQWLLGNGTLRAPYVAAQGTAVGRDGRVHISSTDGEIWVGGDSFTCVEGSVRI